MSAACTRATAARAASRSTAWSRPRLASDRDGARVLGARAAVEIHPQLPHQVNVASFAAEDVVDDDRDDRRAGRGRAEASDRYLGRWPAVERDRVVGGDRL